MTAEHSAPGRLSRDSLQRGKRMGEARRRQSEGDSRSSRVHFNHG